MPEWKAFEIPDNMLGEQRVSKSTYVTTYQTEILLPERSQYAGYYFLHPSKLIGYGAGLVVKVRYNDSFVFTLIKKDREPGKKYKRYKLTAPEILAIYEPEIRKVREREEKRERARLAQVGAVELVVCDWGHYEAYFLFSYKGKYYSGKDNAAVGKERIYKNRIIAEDVQRGVYEGAEGELRSLQDNFGMLFAVQYAIKDGQGSGAGLSEKAQLYNSFDNLCRLWEIELCDKAAAVLSRQSH